MSEDELTWYLAYAIPTFNRFSCMPAPQVKPAQWLEPLIFISSPRRKVYPAAR